MRKLILLLLTVSGLLGSCTKIQDDLLWEYRGGEGMAYFVAQQPDSAVISCGVQKDLPYLLLSSRSGKKIFDYSATVAGRFTSACYDGLSFYAAGSSQSQLLLTKLDAGGELVWESVDKLSVPVENAFLLSDDSEGEFIVLAASDPDGAVYEKSGLYFARFDTAGLVLEESTRVFTTASYSISGAVMTDDGGFVLAATRSRGEARPVAVVMKVNDSLETIWERELMNNPSYSAASLDVCRVADGFAVSGRTELTFEGSLLVNSFIALVSESGSVMWKKYPENSNEGVSVLRGSGDLVYMLNRNCYIVNSFFRDDGSDYNRLRTLNACDSYNTEALASSLAAAYDGSLYMAGSRSGRYYLIRKSSGE